jgi:hypothetical protein
MRITERRNCELESRTLRELTTKDTKGTEVKPYPGFSFVSFVAFVVGPAGVHEC